MTPSSTINCRSGKVDYSGSRSTRTGVQIPILSSLYTDTYLFVLWRNRSDWKLTLHRKENQYLHPSFGVMAIVLDTETVVVLENTGTR